MFVVIVGYFGSRITLTLISLQSCLQIGNISNN